MRTDLICNAASQVVDLGVHVSPSKHGGQQRRDMHAYGVHPASQFLNET